MTRRKARLAAGFPFKSAANTCSMPMHSRLNLRRSGLRVNPLLGCTDKALSCLFRSYGEKNLRLSNLCRTFSAPVETRGISDNENDRSKLRNFSNQRAQLQKPNCIFLSASALTSSITTTERLSDTSAPFPLPWSLSLPSQNHLERSPENLMPPKEAMSMCPICSSVQFHQRNQIYTQRPTQPCPRQRHL